MTHQLAIVKTESQPKEKPQRRVSPSEAARLYAKHKAENSWCIDMSGNYPVMLHALSNITSSMLDLRAGFNQWASSEGLRVDCESYSSFLGTLTDRMTALLPRVYGMGMRPCDDRFIFNDAGIMLANIYNPVSPDTPQSIPAPFNVMVDMFGHQVPSVLRDLFERVFPVEEQRLFMVQRLAAVIRTPERRVKHAVLIVGDGGTGKSTVLDVLETAMYRRHIDRSATYAGTNDPHSETLVNNIVVAYEDKAIGSGGETYVYTNMKQVIDYDRRNVNIKHGQRSVMRELHCNIVITTNNPNLFPWDSNERRFYAPQKVGHLISAEESGEFLSRFHTFLQLPETPAFLYHWLNNVSLDGFDYGRCPRTPFMQELIDSSGTMLDKILDDFLDSRDIFHPTTLTEYLSGRKQIHKGGELKKALEIRGFEYKRQKFKREGFDDARFSVWRKRPPTGRHFRDLTTDEKHELMSTEGCAF